MGKSMAVVSGTAPTRRRWYQFGLGTLFLEVLLVAWLARESTTIYDRRKALAWLKENSVGVMTVDDGYRLSGHWGGEFVPPTIPWWREMLGDAPIPSLLLEPGKSAEKDALKSRCSVWFPEAEIYDPDEH
jgi:hypothetical protein